MALEVDITKNWTAFYAYAVPGGAGDFCDSRRVGLWKSMTLKCIAGIEKPDEGRIVLDGKVLFDSEKKLICRRRSGKSAICSRITPCFRI